MIPRRKSKVNIFLSKNDKLFPRNSISGLSGLFLPAVTKGKRRRRLPEPQGNPDGFPEKLFNPLFLSG
jgi:hypothetical protein